MPRQQWIQRRCLPPPLTYCPLSTRRSSYPSWVMLKGLSTPIVIKTSDLHSNEPVQVLLSSDQVFPVPSIVNDIAEVLSWMLDVNNFPLQFAYLAVLFHLLHVCDWQSPLHTSPYDAHFKISLVVAERILWKAFHPVIISEVMDLICLHLIENWGARITFAGFQNILMDILWDHF